MTTSSNRNRARAALDQVTVVSFDLDDTFWDCAPAIERAEKVLYKWLQQAAPRVAATHDPQSLLAYRNEFRRAHPELIGCVTAMRTGSLKSLLSDFDYDDALSAVGFDIFYKARSEVTLYPGVLEMLDELQKRYRLAAITNGNADLAAIGIDHYFEKICAADLHLKAKPAVDMFDDCCRHFGIDTVNMLHVGDNHITDVQGAVDAGAQSLWFNQHKLDWPEGVEPPHFEAHSIGQVKSLLL